MFRFWGLQHGEDIGRSRVRRRPNIDWISIMLTLGGSLQSGSASSSSDQGRQQGPKTLKQRLLKLLPHRQSQNYVQGQILPLVCSFNTSHQPFPGSGLPAHSLQMPSIIRTGLPVSGTIRLFQRNIAYHNLSEHRACSLSSNLSWPLSCSTRKRIISEVIIFVLISGD